MLIEKEIATIMDDNKRKALQAALSQIEKQFGKGSIMRLGEHEVSQDIQVVSTGSLGLDIALGVGGLPRGRVVEIYGPESSGKTTLTLSVIAQMQKQGGTAAFIDAEHALDPQYARKLGVNVEELLISQPDNGEQALEIADMLVRSGSVDVVVIDSVAALTPKAEIEGEMGEPQMGLQARLMSQALRKLTANIKRSNTLVIFINQIRMKIGVMFGNPETTTGGNALKFYASVRLDIRRIGSIKKGDEVIGSETRVKVVKNKVAPPFRQADFDILYGEGISREGEMIDMGVLHKVIEKSGAWYSYGSDRIGQGKDNAREFLKEHPDMAAEIEAKIRANAGVGRRGGAGDGRGGLSPGSAVPATRSTQRCGVVARCDACSRAREHSRAELKRKLADDDAAARRARRAARRVCGAGLVVGAAAGRPGDRVGARPLRQPASARSVFARRASAKTRWRERRKALRAQELESARAVWRKRFGQPSGRPAREGEAGALPRAARFRARGDPAGAGRRGGRVRLSRTTEERRRIRPKRGMTQRQIDGHECDRRSCVSRASSCNIMSLSFLGALRVPVLVVQARDSIRSRASR